MRPLLTVALRLRLRRLVALRNKALVQYRRLGKAGVDQKNDRIERLIKNRLSEIKRLDDQIAEIQAKGERRTRRNHDL